METRIITFDGEVIEAEKVERITLSRSLVESEAEALKARREELEARYHAVTEELRLLQEQEAALAEQLAIVALAVKTAAGTEVRESGDAVEGVEV
jgi:hypothetical protein